MDNIGAWGLIKGKTETPYLVVQYGAGWLNSILNMSQVQYVYIGG